MAFGICSVVGVIMENLDSEIPGQITEASDEQDNIVGFAIHHTNRADINGGYLFLGSDVTAMGSTIALTTYAPFSTAAERRLPRKLGCPGRYRQIVIHPKEVFLGLRENLEHAWLVGIGLGNECAVVRADHAKRIQRLFTADAAGTGDRVAVGIGRSGD